MAFTALLDANVLHPMVLCDLLLRLALAGFYRPLWSEMILDEVVRSIERRRPDIAPGRLRARTDRMKEAFPDATVVGFDHLLPAVAAFGHDAHVVAAALRGGADVIVTSNSQHFPADQLRDLGVGVQTPDEFLVHQWWLNPQTVANVIVEQAGATKRPALTAAQVIDRLVAVGPEFARLARKDSDSPT